MFDFSPYNINPDDVLPDTKRPYYPSGLHDSGKSHVLYAQPSIKTPTLIIVDTIYNEDLEPVVTPGHYELALSADLDFLLIMQSKNIIAKIPVFKLEKDNSQTQEMYNKKQEKLEWYKFRQRRLKEKKERKRASVGLNPESDDFTYAEATIEWAEEGNYYLIKYEYGSTRAWGAIKQFKL